MSTIQICPVEDCAWIGSTIEVDEDSVVEASRETFRHLVFDHETLDEEAWSEMFVTRVPVGEVANA